MSAYATLATVHPPPETDPPPSNQGAIQSGSAPTATTPARPTPAGAALVSSTLAAPTPIESARTDAIQLDSARTRPMTQGALALRYQLEPELDVAPAPAPPALRLVPAGPRLPDPQAWASKLVQAVAEVLAGDRPISQLVRFTDSVVFGELNRRVRLLGLTTTATARGLKERSAVRSVHVFTPATEVAEVAAHVRYGDRSRAIALRLEVHRGRWICTALELG
jgi:hypothetical protein